MPSGAVQLWERGYRLCGRFVHRRTVRIRVPLIHSPVRTEISSGTCSRSFTNSSIVKRRRVICNGGLESYRQDFVYLLARRGWPPSQEPVIYATVSYSRVPVRGNCRVWVWWHASLNLLVGTAQQTHRTPSRSSHNTYCVKLPCARHVGIRVCGCEGVTPPTLNLGIT